MVDTSLSSAASARRCAHALVVGPPERVGDMVKALRNYGCQAEHLASPSMLPERAREEWPDCIVIDACDGMRELALDATRWLSANAKVPLLLITGPDDVDARISAITLRVDDAIAPVAPREVVARVAAMMHRARHEQRRSTPLGDLTLDRAGRRATRNGRSVALTQRELEVLEALVSRPGEIVSKTELLEKVWAGTQRSRNAVEAQISALRRKLHSIGPPIIHTTHGAGYAFRPFLSPDATSRAASLAQRERLVREREEAVARRAKLLRQMEEHVSRRSDLLADR